MCCHEAAVQLAALVTKHALGHADAGLAQHRYASPRHSLKRVAGADHDAGYAAVDDQLGAWRRLAVVGARLEGDVEGGMGEQAAVSHTGDSVDLGMRLAAPSVEALADDAS